MLAEYTIWGTSLLYAVIILGVGFFIVFREPKSTLSITSFTVFLTAFIWIFTGVLMNMELNQQFNSGNLDYIIRLNTFVGNLFPFLALIWSLTFPKTSSYFNTRNVILLLAVGIPSSLSITIYLGKLYIADNYAYSIYYYLVNRPHLSLIYPFCLNLVVFMVFAFKQLYFYKKEADYNEKGKIKFFLIGFLIAVSFYLASPFIMIFVNIKAHDYLSYFGVSIGSLLATYSIIKLRTIDVPLFLKRLLKAVIKSIVLSTPVIVTASVYIKSNLSAIHILPKSILLIAGVFIYYLYISFVTPKINKLFEKKALNEETALRSLFDKIVGIKSLRETAEIIMDGLSSSIFVNEYSLYVATENSLSLKLLLSNESNKSKTRLFLPKRLSDLLVENNTVVEKSDVNRLYKNRPLINFLEIYFNFFECKAIVPIIYDDRVIAVINIKNKRDELPIYDSDIEFINALRKGIAVGIMNAKLYDDLIREQNKLEDRVRKRTIDLTVSNTKLSEALKELEKKHSELQKAQAYLLQTEKMASLGELVAGVSHEVNSPLATIQSSADMLSRIVDRINTDSFDENNVKNIASFLDRLSKSNIEAVDRISTVFNSLKQFSKLDEADFKSVNIEKDIDHIISLLRYKTQNKIQIKRKYKNIPEVRCYSGELNQVFMNILTNSIESIEDKGEILIETDYKDNTIYIIIEDDGKGISEDKISKIFNPGFTTKGVGIGMGLSVSYNIIKKHKGDILVESKEGKGTKITIMISTNLPE